MPGRASLSLKSINAECNLLEAWLGEQTALRQAIRSRLTLITGTVVFAVVAIPAMTIALGRQRVAESAAMAQRADLSAELAKWTDQRRTTDPAVAQSEMRQKAARLVDQFLGVAAGTLGIAPMEVAVTSSHLEVLGGEESIRVMAESETPAAAQGYVESVAKLSGISSATLIMSRRSDLLAAKGVAFEFVGRETVKR